MPGRDGQGRKARRLAVAEERPTQLSLLEPQQIEGFAYQAEILTPAEEQALVAHFAALDFREFAFRGFTGRRRVVSFGVRYDFDDSRLHAAPEIPRFLLPLRSVSAAFARIEATAFKHALVTEYQPGAGIGWHRDRPVFADVVGISLLSPCRLRLRRRWDAGWQRENIVLEPRSAYPLRGAVRAQWEHSIPPAEDLRYSVTFRSLRSEA